MPMSRVNPHVGNPDPGHATLLLEPRPADPGWNPLAQLVRLVQSNEQLGGRLARLRAQERAARRYLERPGANLVLGAAVCERLGRQRLAVRAQLQANRIEAETWLSPAAEPAARRRRLA